MSRLVQVTPFALAPNSGVVPGWLSRDCCKVDLGFDFSTRRDVRSNDPIDRACRQRFALIRKAQTPRSFTRLTDSA